MCLDTTPSMVVGWEPYPAAMWTGNMKVRSIQLVVVMHRWLLGNIAAEFVSVSVESKLEACNPFTRALVETFQVRVAYYAQVGYPAKEGRQHTKHHD